MENTPLHDAHDTVMVTAALVVSGLVVTENLDGGEPLDSVLGAEGLVLGTVNIDKFDTVSLESCGGLFKFRLEGCTRIYM